MTVIQLANLALLKLGISQGITAVDDQTREALTASLVFDHHLRSSLRRFPWPFATKYRASQEGARHILFLAAGRLWNTSSTLLTTVAAWDATFRYEIGDVVRHNSVNYVCILGNINTAPPNATYWSTNPADGPVTCGNGDWDFAYRWPDDCLFVRRGLKPGAQQARKFDPDPIPFRIGRDENGLLIYSNQLELEIEYTMLDCAQLWSNDLFLDAFTWRLAMAMSPSLERAQKTPAECLAMFELTIGIAEAVDSRESQQEPHGDALWVLAR